MSAGTNGHRPFADHALELAKRFRVHPVNGKVALLDDWPNVATRDAATIRQWIEQYPSANVGIAPSDRGLVIDVDPRHGGWEGLAILEGSAQSDLPRETLTTVTGRDEGRHFYFVLPGGVKVRASRKIAAGVEAKSSGAYLVAPGSVHPETGRIYEWVDPDADILEAPEWLVELVTAEPETASHPAGVACTTDETTRYGQCVLKEEARSVAEMPLGGDSRKEGRNRQVRDSAYAVGTLVGGGEIAYQDAVEELSEAIKSWVPVDGDPRKTRLTLVRGLADGMNQPRNAPSDDLGVWIPEPATALDIAAPAADPIEEQDGNVVDDWPEPARRLPSLPSFPTDVFPPYLRDYVDAEARATQTPPDLVAFSVLGAISTATSRRVSVRGFGDWLEPVHVWTMVALPPGERKSAVQANALRPVTLYEKAERQRLSSTLNEVELRKEIAVGRLAEAKKDATRAKKPDDRARADSDVLAAQRDVDAIDVPRLPQLMLDDVTPEAFAQALADYGRITLASAEGGVFDTFAGRYTAGTPNVDALLKAHVGEAARITRMSRQVIIDRACATLVFAVQPVVLAGLARASALRGRGLLGRFLYAVPTPAVGSRKIGPPPVPPAIAEVYRRRIVELLDGVQPAPSVDDAECPHVLSLTPAAAQRFHAWQEWLEPQLGEGGRLGSIADWASKLAGATLRIAGLLHMAEHGSSGVSDDINDAAIASAIRVAEYLIPHAKVALALTEEDEVAADARLILDWIIDRRPDEIAARDVVAHLNRITAAKQATVALDLLAQRGYLRMIAPPKVGSQGGRPQQPRWIPNPRLWTAKTASNTSKTPSEAGFAGIAGTFDGSTGAGQDVS